MTFDFIHQENKAYQLAVIEQQNQLHDCLSDLNRSLQVNRLERHAEAEELHSQVDGLRQDLNRFFVGPTYGPEHSELLFLDPIHRFPFWLSEGV
jgi:hypothetical protein